MRRRDIRAERQASEARRWGIWPLECDDDWRNERDQERSDYQEHEDDYEQRQMLQ